MNAKSKLTIVIGGARSGKSAFAEELLVKEAQATGNRLVYVASGVATDPEMRKRIEQHQQDRAEEEWVTLEQPVQLAGILPFIQEGDLILWDCATTWLANELYEGWETNSPCIQRPGCMEAKVDELSHTIRGITNRAAQLVIVSNEVLDDWPPLNEETNTYRSWLGRIHQQLVRKADTAIEMDYGLPKYWKRNGAVNK